MKPEILETIDDLRTSYSHFLRWNSTPGAEDHAGDAWLEVRKLSCKLDLMLTAENDRMASKLHGRPKKDWSQAVT